MNILNHFFINKFVCPPAGIYNIVYRAQFQSQRGQSLDLWLHPLWVRNEWLGCTSARRGRLLRLNSCVSKGSEILFCVYADSCQFLYINLESLSPDTELMRLGPPIERSSSLLISYADKLNFWVTSSFELHIFQIMSYEMMRWVYSDKLDVKLIVWIE